MTHDPLCHLLIGIPGSGKSTFARQWVAADPRYRIVSTDRIRAQLFGNAIIQGEWSIVEAQVLAEIRTHLAAGYSVIYDATNTKLEWRLQFLQHFRASENLANIPWMAWWIDTPLAICQQRNQKRDRNVPPDVIDAMATHLQDCPPHPREGFVTVRTVPRCPDGSFDIPAVFRQINTK
jgi:predicted kinase